GLYSFSWYGSVGAGQLQAMPLLFSRKNVRVKRNEAGLYPSDACRWIFSWARGSNSMGIVLSCTSNKAFPISMGQARFNNGNCRRVVDDPCYGNL
ncbi:hypothetical protein, partial [Xanthomonas euvesicatoria]|uniref:hypothetical protein n=2 Tax=Xanthomonas euvesicatoria TaxID=456327 RepID=UPI0019D3D6C7